MTTAPARRIGRPPATDSTETRARILNRARVAFASEGFARATNRSLADAVGVTAGALYHYFGSKLDLYVAVDTDVRARVYLRMNDAADAADGFYAKFEAILDVAQQMNVEDPSLAAFVGSRRVDIRRNSDIADAVSDESDRERRFFRRMVDAGVEAGELDAAQAPFVTELVLTLLAGLTTSESDDVEIHARAIEAIKMVLRGDVFATRS